MRVLFWGSPEFAVAPLEAIVESTHQVVAVVCQPDRPRGRGRKPAPVEVKRFAESRGLKIIQPDAPRGEQFLSAITSLDPQISAVVAYGHILRPEVLEIPRLGSINLHASLLPAYRGAAPIQRAVAAGETTTGLTVIQMDEGMDTGPVLLRREMEIGRGESAGELAGRMSQLGARLLVELLDRMETGGVEPVPQPQEGVSYAPKVERGEARIDWALPAWKISCIIRAFDPSPGAFCICRGKTLKLFRPRPGGERAHGRPGEVTGTTKQEIAVCCGDMHEILVGELQAEGKRRMTAAEYLRGAALQPCEILD